MEHPFGFNADEESAYQPTRHEIAVHEAHVSHEFTRAELDILDWQLGIASGFKTALLRTCSLADDSNLAKLEYAFPDEVIAFREWRFGDLASRFRTRGIEV